MPEMTKGDPERDTSTDAAPEHTGEADCPACGHAAADHDGVVVGSRSWFWDKRIENVFLFLIPAAPLGYGVVQLIAPQVTVDLTDKQEKAINAVYNMPGGSASSVDAVRVALDNPSFMDRLIAAGPSLGFGLILAVVIYALWRIEINLSATGKYTEKDDRVLRKASKLMWNGFWVLLFLEIAVTVWWHDAPQSDHWWLSSVTTPFDNASMMALMASGVMAVIGRIYRSGARAYRELEKGV